MVNWDLGIQLERERIEAGEMFMLLWRGQNKGVDSKIDDETEKPAEKGARVDLGCRPQGEDGWAC